MSVRPSPVVVSSIGRLRTASLLCVVSCPNCQTVARSSVQHRSSSHCLSAVRVFLHLASLSVRLSPVAVSSIGRLRIVSPLCVLSCPACQIVARRSVQHRSSSHCFSAVRVFLPLASLTVISSPVVVSSIDRLRTASLLYVLSCPTCQTIAKSSVQHRSSSHRFSVVRLFLPLTSMNVRLSPVVVSSVARLRTASLLCVSSCPNCQTVTRISVQHLSLSHHFSVVRVFLPLAVMTAPQPPVVVSSIARRRTASILKV